MNPYSSLSDDFGAFVYLNTRLELPTNRETVLHFCESLRKIYPQMTEFDRRDNGEFALEEDRDEGAYRWVNLEPRRLGIGYNRAASIIERMEKEGIVGPANHAGKREILVPTEEDKF